LSGDLEPQVRALIVRLRELKDRAGISTTALARKTPYSRSSWGRYLNGSTFPPRQAVEALGRLVGADLAQLLVLWELAGRAQAGRQAPAESQPAHADGVRVGPAGAGPSPVDTSPAGTAAADPVWVDQGFGPDPQAGPAPAAVDTADIPGARPGMRRWAVAAAVIGAAVVSILAVAAWLTSGDSASQPSASTPTAGYRCDFLTRDGHLYAGHSATTNRLVALNGAGQDVVEVQCLLAHHGFDPGRIDGLFGAHTEQAVKDLQRRGHTTPDGIVGAQTWALLRS
jgi:transcriptional regulator with XRE-family HTH domain